MRRMTQNAERHNLPTTRSAIRMAWQTLSNPELLQGTRLLTLADIMHSDELQKGLNSEHYRDGYLNVCGAIEQLSELDLSPEEREQPSVFSRPCTCGVSACRRICAMASPPRK
jgi:hypothetical protein